MSFGAYYQCYKNPYATYKCLESFRKFYPNNTIVLISNNGYDYAEMTKFFNCKYVYYDENVSFPCTNLKTMKYVDVCHKLIDRIVEVCKLIPEDYVMWLEDDVVVNGVIKDSFRFDINGYCPNGLSRQTTERLHEKYPFIKIGGDYRWSGQGGTVFNKTFLLNSFNGKDIIEDVIYGWGKYVFPDDDVCNDFLLSIIVTLNRGTVGSYRGHGDHLGNINLSFDIQHQYKIFYGKQMPKDIEHLVVI